MNENLLKTLIERFGTLYHRKHEALYFAPGRVNLIGEHTDYNGGHVLPCALPMGTYGAIARRNDRIIRMHSLNFAESGILEVSLDELTPGRTNQWTSYPEGTIWAMAQMTGFLPDCGADLMFAGDVPAGSGLSSSASIEVLTGLMIRDLMGSEALSGVKIAQIAQYGENHYNGMQCGIMDQFASAMGKKDHAVYLNTATLSYELEPLVLGDARIVITNSKVKHSLVSSAYNDRRRECSEALTELRSVPELAGAADLCSLREEDLERYGDRIEDPVVRMRAEHVIREEARTSKAVEALKRGDLAAFGQLMNESHVSLRDLYQVSCPEIDFLTETAWSLPGTIGSRITGGGFGGCTVSIVRADGLGEFIVTMESEYEKKFGRKPEFYVTYPDEGAGKLDV